MPKNFVGIENRQLRYGGKLLIEVGPQRGVYNASLMKDRDEIDELVEKFGHYSRTPFFRLKDKPVARNLKKRSVEKEIDLTHELLLEAKEEKLVISDQRELRRKNTHVSDRRRFGGNDRRPLLRTVPQEAILNEEMVRTEQAA